MTTTPTETTRMTLQHEARAAALALTMTREAAELGLEVFRAGGKDVLDPALRTAVRKLVEKSTGTAIVTHAPLATTFIAKNAGAIGGRAARELGAGAARETGKIVAKEGGQAAVKTVGGETAKKVVATAVAEGGKQLGKQTLKTVARAGGVGILIDGTIGGIEAIHGYRKGEMTRDEALGHAAKEAGTGALASAAGAGAELALVALTGPVGPLAAAFVCGGTSIAAKIGLSWL